MNPAAEAYRALVLAGGELAVDGRRLVVRAPEGAPPEVRTAALAHKRALWWVQSGNAHAEMAGWSAEQSERWLERAQAHLEAGVPREHCGPLAFLEVAAEPAAQASPARVA